MRLLIAGSPSKIIHFKEFKNELIKLGIECKLVIDSDICNGFPSRKISDWFQTQKKFNMLISDFKPDIILVDRQRHFAKIASKYKIPLIIHLRGNIWKEIEWAKETTYKSFLKKIALNVWVSIMKKTFDKSFLIIPICKHLEKIVKKNYPNKKTTVMHQGISPERWYPSKGMKLKHPCVGLLQGAVIWGKSQEMLVLQKVLESMPNVMFYWVGDGPYRDKILPVLEKYDNFKWLGPLQYPDKVREYLSEIDVYALITGMDLAPLSLKEAQLMEKPVIVTNVGGNPEMMVDGKTGFLVEEGNADELFEKLTILFENKEISVENGSNGRKFIEEKFSMDASAKNFIRILDSYVK